MWLEGLEMEWGWEADVEIGRGTTDLEAFPADTWADQQAAGLHSETWAQEEPGCFGDGHHSALS